MTSTWSMPRKDILMSMFHPTLANHLVALHIDYSEISFGQVLLHAIGDSGSLRQEHLLRNPNNITDFFSVMKWVMSAKALRTIGENLARYDELVGIKESLSDELIAQRTFAQWIVDIAYEMDVPNSSYTSPSKSHEIVETAESSTAKLSPPSYHGKKDFGHDGAYDGNGKIEQVHLKGPSIMAAWYANDTLRELENMAGRAAEHEWTPSQAGGLYVYHGTSAHFRYPDWPSTWTSPVHTIRASTGGSQLAPEGVPLVYTAFSPLRSFLWAVFTANIVQNIPSSTTLSQLHQTWSVGEKIFEGIALFQYYSAQPAPSGLSSWTMAPGDELRWVSSILSQKRQGRLTAQESWGRGRTTLGGSGIPSLWPDVLHSQEYGQQRDYRKPFKTNMWRSVWLEGNGVNRLNQDYSKTFAITFDLLTPAGTKDGKESRKGSVKDLAKKISRVFKKNT